MKHLFTHYKKDCLYLSALILIFTALAFFRLGNTYAPETFYTATPENRDIILDFGDYLDVSSVSLFLGHLNTRHFSLSAFNEVTGAWEIINGDAIAESVFAWNQIDINYRLRYLGIVATDDECILNEMVFKAPDGSLLLPVNAGEYPALFDEQDTFPPVKTYMTGTMFDEVYHGRTAYEFLHGLTTYETTHPHLGKELISLGILIFGMNPFGWRFMTVIFGILLIPLMYLFARKLLGEPFLAAATAALLTFDCMHYNLSRIATIDIFAAFFILLMYFFMYLYLQRDRAYRALDGGAESNQAGGGLLTAAKTTGADTALGAGITGLGPKEKFPPRNVWLPLALSGISMALGVATKWTGVYAGLGLGILFLWYTFTHFPKGQALRLFGFCCVFFVAVPLTVYTLCFIPVVGYSPYHGLIDKAIQGTKYMFDYHSKLVAEHYYSSPFYEWPIIWMPLLDANDAVSGNLVSSVSCMGNPAIWWVGIPCQLYVFFLWLVKKDQKAGFLCISYLAQYVPWMSISRITFIYHYFPAILFVMLMMGYAIAHLKEHFSWGKKAVIAYLTVAVVCFFVFFPVISGLPVDKEYGLDLRWLKEWILVL